MGELHNLGAERIADRVNAAYLNSLVSPFRFSGNLQSISGESIVLIQQETVTPRYIKITRRAILDFVHFNCLNNRPRHKPPKPDKSEINFTRHVPHGPTQDGQG